MIHLLFFPFWVVVTVLIGLLFTVSTSAGWGASRLTRVQKFLARTWWRQ